MISVLTFNKGGKMEELKKLLESHDWYYMYSDDSRSYNKGRDSNDKIKQLVAEIGKEADKLYKESAPEGYWG
ncbi:MAG: hypothetical protein CL489_17750 [Acidobacteria bacterium]|nr:hypothetical protein [Acidobacteriota bacterium]